MSEASDGGVFRPLDALPRLYTDEGTWVARNCDASALYTFASEIDALRFANREGYYMEVLAVPHGEDALRYVPPKTS